jgi:hypothetical protein
MTYSSGSNIQAADYNSFATYSLSMNQMYADLYPGTVPSVPGTFNPSDNCTYGYGQTALTPVTASSVIHLVEWNNLFNVIRKTGTHQGTVVQPPLPAVNPTTGSDIQAYGGLGSLINVLNANRFNLAAGQTAASSHLFAQPGATNPWTVSLTFTCQIDFGSWNNARYFFNSGGFLAISGSYVPSGIPTAEDVYWINTLGDMSPLIFNYSSTLPNVSGGGSAVGFYGLTTVYQSTPIYKHSFGTAPYAASFISVNAKFVNAIGSDGLIEFTIQMIDNDTNPDKIKTGTTTFNIQESHSTSQIIYPGSVSIASVGANNGFVAT